MKRPHVDLDASSLGETLRLARTFIAGSVRLSPRQRGLEVAAGTPAAAWFRGVLPWERSPPSRTGGTYELSLAMSLAAERLLERHPTVSLRVAEDVLQLWTPERALQAVRLRPAVELPLPRISAKATLEAAEAEELANDLEALLEGTEEGAARLVLTLSPAIGNICLLLGSEALTSRSLGVGAEVEAGLEAQGRYRVTFAPRRAMELMQESWEDLELCITDEGGLLLRGSEDECRWEGYWPGDAPTTPTSAPRPATPRVPVPAPSDGPSGWPSPGREGTQPPPIALGPLPAGGIPGKEGGDEVVAVATSPAHLVEPETVGETVVTPDVPQGPPPAPLPNAYHAEKISEGPPPPSDRGGRAWARELAERWARTSWVPASSPSAWREAVEHWSEVLTHLQQRWPDLPEPPWEGWDPANACHQDLVRLLFDPRVLLSHLVLACEAPVGFVLDMVGEIVRVSAEGEEPGVGVFTAPPGRALDALRELARVGVGFWKMGGTPEPAKLELPLELVGPWRKATENEMAVLWAGIRRSPSAHDVARVGGGPHLPLAVLLAMAQRGELKATQLGPLYKASRTRLREALSLPSDGVADLVHRVAVDLELAKTEDGLLRPEEGALKFFERSESALRDRWMAVTLFWAGRATRALLQVLGEVPAGDWITLPALAIVTRRRMERLSSPRSACTWSHPAHEIGTALELLLLSGMIEASVSQPAEADGAPRELRELRLTDTGRTYLATGDGSPVSPMVPSTDRNSRTRFHVLPDYEVTVPAESLAPSDAWALAQTSDLISADRMVRFRISRDRVASAAREGFDGAALLRFLRERSPRAVPQNVATAIVDWGPRQPHVVVAQHFEVQGLDHGAGAAAPADRQAPLLSRLRAGLPVGARLPGRFQRWGEGPSGWAQLLLSWDEIGALRKGLEEAQGYGEPVPPALRELWDFLGARLPGTPSRARNAHVPTLEELGGIGDVPLGPRTAPPAAPPPPCPSPCASKPPSGEVVLTETEELLRGMIRRGSAVVAERRVRETTTYDAVTLTPYCLVAGEGNAVYLVAGDHRTSNLQLLRTSRFADVKASRVPAQRRTAREIYGFLEGLAGAFQLLEPPPGASSWAGGRALGPKWRSLG